jgi:hypothetical protein
MSPSTPSPATLADLATAMAEFLSNLESAQEATTNPLVRHQLATMAESVRSAHSQFAAEYQRLDAAFGQRLAETRKLAEETMQRLQQVQSDLDAAAAAVPEMPSPPEPPPEPPVDGELADRLRDELLELFGDLPARGSRGPRPDDRELWQDWTW